ncbi:MAG: hypothetical protein Q9M48_10620 [Rhodobacterales bacterium]|nr:hypothetical protein [Rhodobacterales bacterium]
MLSQIIGFPLAHWRGQIALLPTILFTLVGVRLLISAVGGIGFFTLDAGIFCWQAVGSLRAAARYQRDTPDLMISLATYAGVVICIPLLLWPQLDRVAQEKLSGVIEPEAASSGVILVPTYVVLSGPIDFVMFDALEAALAKHPQIRRVVFNSEGGRVFAARSIARIIRENGLDTHVDGICASACTVAFIAGGARSMAANARLGFHRYGDDGPGGIINTEVEETKDRSVFLATGVSADFAGKMYQAAPQDMWFPEPGVLRDAGVLTR